MRNNCSNVTTCMRHFEAISLTCSPRCTVMVSTADAAPALLFVLTLNSCAVDGIGIIGGTGENEDGGKIRSSCLRNDYIHSEADSCFHGQNLPSFRFPWDPEFVSFVDAFATRFEEDAPQFQAELTEAYYCFYNSCRDCYEELRADTDTCKNTDIQHFLQDLEFYAPDPELMRNALRDICQEEDEDWLCFDNTTKSGLLVCGFRAIQAMVSQIAANDLTDLGLSINNFKPAVCGMFSGFQRCTTDHLKACPQKTVSMVSRLVNQMTPPACNTHGQTGLDQDEALQSRSAHVHDEH